MGDVAASGCPRCGAPREPGQQYCVDCGLRLPRTDGALARARRGWVRVLGWYPGDWVWAALFALVVAAAGAALAIYSTRASSQSAGSRTVYATALSVALAEPATTAPTAAVDTSALPTPPEPGTGTSKAPPPGETRWPAGEEGWTVVLESVPATEAGRKTAQARAERAAKDGLPDVGVLTSVRYSTLHPGYLVIFSGIFDTRAQAESNLRAATSAGFSSAYVRQIAQ